MEVLQRIEGLQKMERLQKTGGVFQKATEDLKVMYMGYRTDVEQTMVMFEENYHVAAIQNVRSRYCKTT